MCLHHHGHSLDSLYVFQRPCSPISPPAPSPHAFPRPARIPPGAKNISPASSFHLLVSAARTDCPVFRLPMICDNLMAVPIPDALTATRPHAHTANLAIEARTIFCVGTVPEDDSCTRRPLPSLLPLRCTALPPPPIDTRSTRAYVLSLRGPEQQLLAHHAHPRPCSPACRSLLSASTSHHRDICTPVPQWPWRPAASGSHLKPHCTPTSQPLVSRRAQPHCLPPLRPRLLFNLQHRGNDSTQPSAHDTPTVVQTARADPIN
jgi:hypothetical protein